MDAKDFAQTGYTVQPSVNGGFIVGRRNDNNSGLRPVEASFTNSRDLLDWLTEGHSAVEGVTARRRR